MIKKMDIGFTLNADTEPAGRMCVCSGEPDEDQMRDYRTNKSISGGWSCNEPGNPPPPQNQGETCQ